MKLNTRATGPLNHELSNASYITPAEELERTVMSCLLWEKQFYENGVSIATRIGELVTKVSSSDLVGIVIRAANDMHLRHAPLLLIREMARHTEHKKHVKQLLVEVIRRPDQVTEFMSIYWMDGRTPIANCVKAGLKQAISGFSEYQIAKYSGANDTIKLRDVMFMVHAKPMDLPTPNVRYTRTERLAERRSDDLLTKQELLFRKLADNVLEAPDTWEHALMTGADKKGTFERLMSEHTLGALATLRNIRNMTGAGINERTIAEYLQTCNTDRIYPYQFIASSRYVSTSVLRDTLESLMYASVKRSLISLTGTTLVVVDVSGSMNEKLSDKSDMTRLDAAVGVAIIAREISDNTIVYSFSTNEKLVPPGRGFDLGSSIVNSQPHGGTSLRRSLESIMNTLTVTPDRIIVITDEQSHDGIMQINTGNNYIVNVASYQNGVGYNMGWTHVSGWSDKVLNYIEHLENRE
jgi:60 kDa SS-A/Ro ribonucleoprotein